jgi:hypothetical protein
MTRCGTFGKEYAVHGFPGNPIVQIFFGVSSVIIFSSDSDNI